MTHNKKHDWTPLPLELLLPYIIVLIGIAGTAIFIKLHFLSLSYLWEISFSALTLGIVGLGLLFVARLPLYRQRQFFKLGPKLLDSHHRKFYWSAYACIGLSISILFLLLITV